MKRIYLAGPMTGRPEFNYPAFHAAAAKLRAQGHVVLNPADNPAPACGRWEGWMRLGLAQLVTCEQIALLPDWRTSRGARLELALAQQLGLSVRLLDGAEPPAADGALAQALATLAMVAEGRPVDRAACARIRAVVSRAQLELAQRPLLCRPMDEQGGPVAQ